MRPETPRQGQRKGQAPRVRLGMGDFVPAGAPNPFARMAYLQAVTRCVPKAMSALLDLKQDDDAQLTAWAEKWGFTDEWALSSVRRHLPFWRDEPDKLGTWLILTVASWEPSYGQEITLASGERATVVQYLSWNPIAETEAAFRVRVNQYIEAMKSSPGMERTPEKSAVSLHFEWLALHHVAEWTYPRIDEKYGGADGIEPGSIGEAIRDLAKSIGLTLRPGPGRK